MKGPLFPKNMNMPSIKEESKKDRQEFLDELNNFDNWREKFKEIKKLDNTFDKKWTYSSFDGADIDENYISNIQNTISDNKISKDIVLKLAKKYYINSLKNSNEVSIARQIRNEFLKDESDFLNSREVLSTAENMLTNILVDGSFDIFDDRVKEFFEIYTDDDKLRMYRKAFKKCLDGFKDSIIYPGEKDSRQFLYNATKIKDKAISLYGNDKFAETEQLYNLIKVIFIEIFSSGNFFVENIDYFEELFPEIYSKMLLDADIKSAVKNSIINVLPKDQRYTKDIIYTKNKFLSNDADFLNSNEAVFAAKTALDLSIKSYSFKEANVILNELLKTHKDDLECKNIIHNSLKSSLLNMLLFDCKKESFDWVWRLQDSEKYFPEYCNKIFKEQEIFLASEVAFVKIIPSANPEDVVYFKNSFLKEDTEFLNSPEILNILEEKISKEIKSGKFVEAKMILNEFFNGYNTGDPIIKERIYTIAKNRIIDMYSGFGNDNYPDIIVSINMMVDLSIKLKEFKDSFLEEFKKMSEDKDINFVMSKIISNILDIDPCDIYAVLPIRDIFLKDLKEFSNDNISNILKNKILPKENQDVQRNFVFLEENFKLKPDMLINVFKNVHDNTLFVDKIINLDKEKQDKIIRIVLKNVIDIDTDFTKLNEYFGYFDIDKYIEENGEKMLNNFNEFERYCLMQKFNIKIPDNASDKFKDAMQEFIAVKGIDIKFLKRVNDLYQGGNGAKSKKEQQDNNEVGSLWNDRNVSDKFAKRLIDIIEGREDINQKQKNLLKQNFGDKFLGILGLDDEIEFDPLNKLVFTSIGIKTLNDKTLDYIGFLNDKNGLGHIQEIILNIDKENKNRLQEKKEEDVKAVETDSKKTEKEKNLKIKQIKDSYEKELKSLIFSFGDASNVVSFDSDNFKDLQFKIGSDKNEEILTSFETSLDNSYIEKGSRKIQLKELVLNTLQDFYQKSDLINSCIDLSRFESIIEISNKIFGDIDRKYKLELEKEDNKELSNDEKKKLYNKVKNELSGNEILLYFKNKEFELLSLIMYLAINNKKRQSESITIRNEIGQIINQNKYKKKFEELKNQKIIPNDCDIFLSYFKGDIPLDNEDNENVKNILKNHGYKDIGRKLKIEIGEKNDPRFWTCGNKTNCCMTFTSTKNQEYLLREDMSYFGISIEGKNGDEDLIAQSVLVYSKEKDGTIVIALDNIEIANRAIKYRQIVAEGYKKLKEYIVSKLHGQKFKIVIGTSYNDDGGLITGNCSVESVMADPLLGEMGYSDWHHHSNNFVYYDSENPVINYMGLANYTIEENDTILKQMVNNTKEVEDIKKILDKVGQGEDDGDDGLDFPDNYSRIIGNKNDLKGFIIAADYLKKDDEKDYVTFEKIKILDEYSVEEKKDILSDYLKQNKFEKNEDIDGLQFSEEIIRDNPWVIEIVENKYKKKIKNGILKFK